MFVELNEILSFYSSKMRINQNIYRDILIKLIKYPERYCGLFRPSSIKTKIIQNITQSYEIKFGDFIEEITSLYLQRMGYRLLNNTIKTNTHELLKIDQLFTNNETIYLVEQKIRDDHDSTKKRGQILNFIHKILAVKNIYPNKKICASMWFVDEHFTKNKNFYLEQINKEQISDVTIDLYYGDQFFNQLNEGLVAWKELLDHLIKIKESQKLILDNLLDFNNNEYFINEVINLPDRLWNKLLSEDILYSLLRKELFDNETILRKIKETRNKKIF